ncbi:MAG: hypothetical protein Q8M09_09815 [Pseudomonadota bacterium]|nr:hypothetical protein [Pseudomonadota bacterium]MDP2351618.1 hypothetical protein [Pseudomonadota bacterium]
MELKSTQFDMTDPFTRQEHLAREVERHLLAMPEARRQPLLARALPPVMIGQVQPVETRVHFATVPVPEWPLGQAMPAQPTVIFRPRRIRRPLARQEWLLLVTLRLVLRLRSEARRQLRLKLKATRRLMRRVLPHRKPMRGARAR